MSFLTTLPRRHPSSLTFLSVTCLSYLTYAIKHVGRISYRTMIILDILPCSHPLRLFLPFLPPFGFFSFDSRNPFFFLFSTVYTLQVFNNDLSRSRVLALVAPCVANFSSTVVLS